MYNLVMVNLSAAGLNDTETKCYLALLERKEWRPAELAQYVNESRTNCYKILDSFVELGLAERFDKNKKLAYKVTNPSRLLQLARDKRIAREKSEKALETHTEELIKTYFETNEQPGVRYFEGQSEIGRIFEEMATSKEEVLFIHTRAGIDFYGFETMHNLRMFAVNAGVHRRALTPDTPLATKDFRLSDPEVLLKRTWLKKEDYGAPVEWGAFEDKLYIISYGNEAMGMIIESEQIASSFKELFELLERGQKLLPDYHKLPSLANKAGETSARL